MKRFQYFSNCNFFLSLKNTSIEGILWRYYRELLVSSLYLKKVNWSTLEINYKGKGTSFFVKYLLGQRMFVDFKMTVHFKLK